MSAKGRGAPVTESEFYPTPAWCTRRILEALCSLYVLPCTWLEPCAGDGAIVSVIHELAGDCIIDGGDIRSLPSCVPHCWTVGGFETHTERHDVVITNPPFSLAEPLIDHFLPRCDWLILLLRASFKLVNSDGRDYRNNMPDEYKLPQRPEFVASERCDGVRRGKRGYASLGRERERCDWERKVALTEPKLTACPMCFGNVQRSTTDAAEYSWFVWTPERGRRFGRTCVLPDTSLEERRKR